MQLSNNIRKKGVVSFPISFNADQPRPDWPIVYMCEKYESVVVHCI